MSFAYDAKLKSEIMFIRIYCSPLVMMSEAIWLYSVINVTKCCWRGHVLRQLMPEEIQR